MYIHIPSIAPPPRYPAHPFLPPHWYSRKGPLTERANVAINKLKQHNPNKNEKTSCKG